MSWQLRIDFMFTLVCCQEHRLPVFHALFPGGIQGQWQPTPSTLAIPTQKLTVLNPLRPLRGVSGVFGPQRGDQDQHWYVINMVLGGAKSVSFLMWKRQSRELIIPDVRSQAWTGTCALLSPASDLASLCLRCPL